MKTWRSVLRYSSSPPSRSTVRRYYDIWRKEHGLPHRCDNPKCQFYTAPLIWNEKPLKLVLDHIEGNRYDNHPASLRYLCPNCDAQLETRGGANRGRVYDVTEDGYKLRRGEGKTIVATTARFTHANEANIRKFLKSEGYQLNEVDAQQGPEADG